MKTFFLFLTLLLLSFAVSAHAEPAAPKSAAFPIYPKPIPKDCYVLLKSKGWPHVVESGDYPVCWAVLKNMNKFCNEPPQYERRKLHPTTTNLKEPNWQPMDPRQNMDIIKEFLSPGYSQNMSVKAATVAGYLPRVEKQMNNGDLKLFSADIDIDNRGLKTVYRAEHLMSSDDYIEYLVAEFKQRRPSDHFDGIFSVGDLVSFRKSWYFIKFHSYEKYFTVKEVSRATEGDAGVLTRCTFQHINDRPGRK